MSGLRIAEARVRALSRAVARLERESDDVEHPAAIDGVDVARLREDCAVDGDWGGTEWGEVILVLLDRVETAEVKVARLEELADGYGHAGQVDVANAITVALADQSAQDGLSRAGTTSVASGATGDTTGAQRGAQGIEGGKA